MYIAQIRAYDVANGPGIRSTLFVSGCTHNCKNCFNKEAQNFKYGTLYDKNIEEQYIQNCKNDRVVGVSILGGEPMEQGLELLNLLKRIKEEVKKPIWLWSGYLYEEIIADPIKKSILECVDVLIDGEFIEEQKDLMLLYRGSKNQRVINVIESLKTGNIVPYII